MTRKETMQVGVVLACLSQPFFLFGQQGDLKVDGPYTHGATKVEYPVRIEQYKRINVRAYDNARRDVSASYEWITEKGQSLVTVYVFPAGEATEGRLRNHFLSAMGDMRRTMGMQLDVFQYPRSYSLDGFKINGYSGTIVNANVVYNSGDVSPFSSVARVTVFECGQWFFKIRTTTALLDSAEVTGLETRFLETFRPTAIVKQFPLNLKGKVTIAEEATRDPVMLTGATGSAFQKLAWAKQHVDSLERLAGFPDLYLGMNVEAYQKFIELVSANPAKKKSGTKKYLKELTELSEAGFLEEFVVELFMGVMIVPKEIVLDSSGYMEWRRKHKSKVDFNEEYYLVGY